MKKKDLNEARKLSTALRRYQRTGKDRLTVRATAVIERSGTMLKRLCDALEAERAQSIELRRQIGVLVSNPEVAALAAKLVASDAAIGGQTDLPQLATELAQLRGENADLKFEQANRKAAKRRAVDLLNDIIAP